MQADDNSNDPQQENNAATNSNARQGESATNHRDYESAAYPHMSAAKRMIAWPNALRNFFWRLVAGLKAIDSLITAIATVAVAFATVFLYWATSDLVDDSKRSFEIANRAWIAPEYIALTATPEKGKPIGIELRYDNVGKLPALDLHERYTLHSVPDSTIDDGSAMKNIVGKTDVCDGVDPWKDAEVAYPGAGGTSLTLTLKPIDPKTGKSTEIYESFMAGNRTLIVQFCIAYRTFEATRKSAFCYLYRPNVTVGLNLNRCDKGNNAT